MDKTRLDKIEDAIEFIASYASTYGGQMFPTKVREILNPPDPDKFMECDSCRAKPGSPDLCKGCLHNRTLISKLNK